MKNKPPLPSADFAGVIQQRRSTRKFEPGRAVDRAALHRGGAEVVDVPSAAEERGCSAAVRVVMDALELSYTKRNVGAVVLVATSIQMLPLVSRLQQNGLTVIGVGGPNGDAGVRAQCDSFVEISPQRRESAR